MRGVEYAELAAFLAGARERSFRRAADALAVSPSAISHTVRALEERLGARLVNRTTRSVSLTEAGQRLHDRLAPAFADIKGAVQEIATGAAAPSGLVRLTVPRVAAQMVLAPILGSFLASFPKVRLEVTVDDALVDSVADGFDAGIRLADQVRRDMDAVAVSGSLRGVVVGSPAYLAAHGTPGSPHDLHRFRWLNYRQPFSGRLLPWEFVRGSETVALSLDGPLASNDPDLLIAAALDGAGLGYLTEATVADHLATGRLLRVLEDWCPTFPGWQLYFPKGRHIAPALKALIGFLSQPSR